MLIIPLETIDDFNLLEEEVFDLINTIGENSSQIICQNLNPDEEDWSTGVGRINELEYQDEYLYKFINKSLKGTRLDHYISKHKGFRTRIMIMNPRQCYSIHADPTPRIHIPIVTDDQAWMIWPYQNVCERMKKGKVYWVDTTKHHTFINGGDTIRIHIVMGVEK
jgi:hypothetical protein